MRDILAKKPARVDPVAGPVFGPSGSRPLSISNTDIRIIAWAVRLLVVEAVRFLVSLIHRGFIRGVP